MKLKSRGRSRIIAAVDIGTAKVDVVVDELSAGREGREGREVNIIGHGMCASRGVVKGSVVDLPGASGAVHEALEEAERSAGRRVEGIFLAQSGRHLAGFYNYAEAAVVSAENIVGAGDVAGVCRSARAKEAGAGRVVVHEVRQPFALDGRAVRNPVGMSGRRLGAGYWIAHGAVGEVAGNVHIANGWGVRVEELMLSSLASGAMVTSEEERRNGVLVIDAGAGVCDFAWYRDGCAWRTGVLAVGGNHLSNDLSVGLRMGFGDAEGLKVKFGRGNVLTRTKTEKTWLRGERGGRGGFGDREISIMSIEQITAARTQEMFEVIKKMLGAEFETGFVSGGEERKDAAAAMCGVVLTGGTSRLAGIADAAAKVFGCAAWVGELPENIHESLRAPEHATALGLLNLGLNAGGDEQRDKQHGAGDGFLSGAGKFWRKWLG